jgi:hypothetical protein
MYVLSGRGKKKGPQLTSDDIFIDELQEQWARDRERKGKLKRERAVRRQEEVQKAGGKKSKKERQQSRNSEIHLGSAVDMRSINARIREFILHQPHLESLSLPPMKKRDRVGIHLLAEAYSLKSKSMGSGKGRFPVLIRTARTAVYGVNERHIEKIIGSAEGEIVPRAGARKGRLGALWGALGGDEGTSTEARSKTKNHEGTIVGHGAGKLDEDNLGFRLLRQMGCVCVVDLFPSFFLSDCYFFIQMVSRRDDRSDGRYRCTIVCRDQDVEERSWKHFLVETIDAYRHVDSIRMFVFFDHVNDDDDDDRLVSVGMALCSTLRVCSR